MRTVEDRLHALSTAPAPAPPALGDLRTRVRTRRRHRAATAAGALAVLVALAVLARSTLAGTDGASDVVAGPAAEEPTSDPCEGVAPTSPGLTDASVATDDPVRLACLALQEYGNNEPPAAVRIGEVDTPTFQDWQRDRTEAIGPVNGPDLPDTVTVLLVRASDGELRAPHPRPGSPSQLRGDAVYAVFAEDLSPRGVRGTGTGTWSEIVASPWAQDLEEVEIN